MPTPKRYINGHFGAGISYSRGTPRDTTPEPVRRLESKRRELRARMFRLEETAMYCRSMEKKAAIMRKLVEMQAKLSKLDKAIRKGA